jgi:transketolase
MEKLKPTDRHESMRGYFAYELYDLMSKDENIWLITSDLGYGQFDKIKSSSDRFINVGASEQAATGIAVGMALEGKIPVLYSITPFLLYRPFETIRNYIHHEQIPVILIGSGRDRSYSHDGFSHWAEDAKIVLEALPNIQTVWPETKEEIPELLRKVIYSKKPTFVSLMR